MIFTREILDPIFDLVEDCRGVTQDPVFHPEGDVYTHSWQCISVAMRESTDPDAIIAALVHDIGKKKGSHGHEDYATEVLKDLVSPKTLWLVEQHMRIWYYLDGTMKRLGKVQALMNHPWLPELVQLARWDHLARKKISYWCDEFDRDSFVERLNQVVKQGRGW